MSPMFLDNIFMVNVTPHWQIASNGRTINTWGKPQLPECGELCSWHVGCGALETCRWGLTLVGNKASKTGLSLIYLSCTFAWAIARLPRITTDAVPLVNCCSCSYPCEQTVAKSGLLTAWWVWKFSSPR